MAKNRNILMNQLVSTGLIVLGGALMMVSTSVTGLLVSVTRAGPVVWWDADNRVARTAAASPWLQAMFKLPSIPITILILFLVYWLLPNTKVPWRLILPRAAVIGLILECLKWINLVIWPWVFDKFKAEYGPFVNTVTIITWSYIAGLIVLAGGDWSARRARAAEAAAAEAVLDPTVAAPVETSPNPGGGGRIG